MNNIPIPNEYLQQFVNSKVGDMFITTVVIHDEIKDVFVEIEAIKRNGEKVVSVSLKEVEFHAV